MRNPFKKHNCPSEEKMKELEDELDATNFVHSTLKARHEMAEKFIVDLNKENKYLKDKINYFDEKSEYS